MNRLEERNENEKERQNKAEDEDHRTARLTRNGNLTEDDTRKLREVQRRKTWRSVGVNFMKTGQDRKDRPPTSFQSYDFKQKRTPLRNFMKVSGLRYPCRSVLKILSSGMWRRVTWPKQKHAATAYPEDGVSSFLRMSVNFYQKIGRHISKHIIIIIIHIKMC
jgi:hypothetical protein